MSSEDTAGSVPARAALALLVLGLAAHALYVGDIPFLCDEPAFLAMAFTANQGGRLAATGLVGSFGATYSPVPVWIYQVLLGVTLNIERLATIKILLVSAVLAYSMWRLRETTKLTPWPLLLIPVSPFLAFYQRLLWDNVFLIPVIAGMLAVTASFLAHPTAWTLGLLAVLSALAFHIHVMAAAPIAACGVALLLFRRAWLVDRWRVVVPCAALALVAAAPLVYAMAFHHGEDVHPHPALVDALIAPLQGFLYWSHGGFDRFMESFYAGSPIVGALETGGAWLMAAAGVAALVALGAHVARRRTSLREGPVRDQMAVLAGLVVIGQTLLLFGLRLDPRWHYFNAVCLGYFYLLWWAFDRIRQSLWARGALAVYGLAMAALTVALAVHVHERHGDRSDQYGAVLGNQMQVAQALVGHAVGGVSLQVDNYAKCPQALELLVYTRAAETKAVMSKGSDRATVRYAGDADDDGRIEVVFEPSSP